MTARRRAATADASAGPRRPPPRVAGASRSFVAKRGRVHRRWTVIAGRPSRARPWRMQAGIPDARGSSAPATTTPGSSARTAASIAVDHAVEVAAAGTAGTTRAPACDPDRASAEPSIAECRPRSASDRLEQLRRRRGAARRSSPSRPSETRRTTVPSAVASAPTSASRTSTAVTTAAPACGTRYPLPSAQPWPAASPGYASVDHDDVGVRRSRPSMRRPRRPAAVAPAAGRSRGRRRRRRCRRRALAVEPHTCRRRGSMPVDRRRQCGSRRRRLPTVAATSRSTSAPIPARGRRRSGARRRSPSAHAPHGPEQAAAAPAAARASCGRRPEAERVGVAGVDAADERVDEALEHLVAEPVAGRTRPSGRRVDAVARAGRRLERGPHLARATTAARPWRARRGRPARRARARRDGVQRRRDQTSAVPVRGATSSSPRPSSPGELDARRARGRGTRRRPRRRGQAGERRRADLAAQPVVGLEHGDVGAVRRSGELVRRGQPGDAAADDGDPRPSRSSISRSPARPASASAPITAGSSLTHAVRAKARPSARRAARLDVEVVEHLEVVGDEAARRRRARPSASSALRGRRSRRGCRARATARVCGRPICQAMRPAAPLASPAAAATASAVARSSSGYGSPASMIRCGQRVGGEQHLGVRPASRRAARTSPARNSTNAGSVAQLSMPTT